jgi:tape measure domain-containing protein
MAESYSVKAILSATDRGFTSTLRNALSSVTGLAKSVGSGMLMGAGMAAFNALTNGAREMVGEINDSNVAWKTFESNMGIIGKSAGEIATVKGELQDFAQKTVYSASDMASTFAQLAAVGTKNTSQLVKGFGGLAAAAENPQQAMKTLSQQATQMAAKPKVQWADFKLTLEQTPAGMAAVAKAMGMTTSELVTAVQDGKVKTEDFFNTIATVGGDANGEFYKMATEAKSVGQAMDGLKETVGNKLTPAFDLLSSIGIKAIEGISDKLGKIDGEAIASKLSGWIKKAQPMWNSFTKAVSKVWAVLSGVGKKLAPIFDSLRTKAGGAIQGMLDKIGAIDANAIVEKLCGWAQKAQPYFDMFSSAIQIVSNAISTAIPYVMDFASAIGGFLLNNSEQICSVISKATPIVLGLVGAFKAFNIIKAIIPGVSSFVGIFGSLAKSSIGNLAGRFFKISTATNKVGKSSSVSGKQMLTLAKSFVMIGAGVLLVAAGFALLAQSAIALSNAGGLAIGVMAGLVIAVAALSIGMMAMMKTVTTSPAKMTAMATAMIALGAAVLMIGVGFALMAQSSIALANAGGLAIGVMVGMVAVVALLAVGAAALGTALTAGAVGFVAFGAALVLVGVGAVLAAAALTIVASVLPTIATYGAQGAGAIALLGAGMTAFAVGAALAGAAAIVLGAGLVVAGAGALVAAAGVLALGAGAIVMGAGLMICAASVTMLAAVFPVASSGAIMLTASFAALLGVSAALGAALLIVNAPLLTVGASALVASAGIIVFGAGMVTGAAGAVVMAAALKAVQSSMKSIASSAKTAESSLKSMQSSVKTVESGLNALGSKAKSAMKSLTSAFDDTASKAKSAGKKVGEGFTTGVQSGLAKAPAIASQITAQVAATLMSGYAPAYKAGAYISQGFAQGMLSCLAVVRAAAQQLAQQAQAAIEAKAKIASPSKVTTSLGQFFGEGFAIGISDMTRDVQKASERLVSIPQVATPGLAMAYSGEMEADYDYYRNATYTIVVPLGIDGRETAKAIATYTQEELDRIQTRENRKHGKR